ncbi:hypothetical protein cym2001_46560 [Pseudomonas sp. CYM-20-01]|nr:hypothetical protein cym2001_46560 [Pseudomonas sp. CYM-20-01]
MLSGEGTFALGNGLVITHDCSIRKALKGYRQLWGIVEKDFAQGESPECCPEKRQHRLGSRSIESNILGVDWWGVGKFTKESDKFYLERHLVRE